MRINIRVKDNTEIECMDKNTLLANYLELQSVTAEIEMSMKLIKMRLQALLEKEGVKKFTNEFGEVSLITQQRKMFQQGIAKEFLTEEQVSKCYIPKEVKFIKVISAESKEKQVF